MFQYKEIQKNEKRKIKNNSLYLHSPKRNTFDDIRMPLSNKPLQMNTFIPIVQKYDWRTRSLQDEPKKIENSKIHHTLPQTLIKQLVDMLEIKDKLQVLKIFGRIRDGVEMNQTKTEMYLSHREGTVTISDKPLDENGEKILNEKVRTTLLSLRSNLTVGPDSRSDDPKDQLDPNWEDAGKLDAISMVYEDIYKFINEVLQLKQEQSEKLKQMDATKNPYAERQEDEEFYHKRAITESTYQQLIQERISSIIGLLVNAEQILATMQNVAINETSLRDYDGKIWVVDPKLKGKGGKNLYRKKWSPR